MKQKLGHIANLQSGLYIRPEQEGEITCLQVKDFNDEGIFISKLHPDLPKDSKTERHLLQKGDIIFAAKGFRNYAALYQPEMGLAIASSNFIVIKPDKNKILPEYLAWYINHPSNMKNLRNEAKGTSIPSLTMYELNKIDIYIPSLKTQNLILEVDALRKKERQLRARITDLKNSYIEQLLIKSTKTNGR